MGKIIVLLVIFVQLLPAHSLAWSEEEKALIASHPLTCITTALWPPFNTKVNGRLAGIGLDYWAMISQRLGIPFRCDEAASWADVLENIRHKHYDLTVATQPTAARKKYAVFSKPYARYPFAVVTRNDVGFIHDIRLIRDRRIVVGRGYTIDHILHKAYPNLHIVQVDSLEKALETVKNGRAFAAVDALPVVAYLLNKNAFGSLKISGVLPEMFRPRIMLHRDNATFLPLINRAIDSVTEEERNQINRRWIMVEKRTTYPLEYLYALLAVIFLLTFWFYNRSRLLKKEIRRKEADIEKLERLASVDSLTLIYNRHMLDTILTQQIATAERYRQLLSVIFFDIDRFKSINDRYGHSVGDDVLVALTELVAQTVRESDIFGRWGGDEFLIILPESSQKQAQRLVKALEKKILDYTFPGVGHLSCSFGMVSYRFGDTMKTLIERADAKLYEVKKYRGAGTREHLWTINSAA